MPKYPDTKIIITRLMIEAGFRNDDGSLNRKGFCEATGITPRTLDNYIKGATSISVSKLRSILDTLGIETFKIVD
jgi:transcriptional regulator with XRE-family HTH domain